MDRSAKIPVRARALSWTARLRELERLLLARLRELEHLLLARLRELEHLLLARLRHLRLVA